MMNYLKSIAMFFRISEEDARDYLTDSEMFRLIQENHGKLSFRRAW